MRNLANLSRLALSDQFILDQVRNDLQAKIHRLIAKGVSPSEPLTKLEECLSADLSWPMLNKVEQELVDYFDQETLEIEWQRGLAEIDELPPTVVSFYNQMSVEVSVEKLRVLLSRLINDLQKLRETKRAIQLNRNLLRNKTIGLFIFGFLLFFGPVIMASLANISFTNIGFYYLYTGTTAGLFGAGFSQLTSLNSRIRSATLEQVIAMSQTGYIIARGMMGMGAGLIMFYLLQSGMLAGQFFPKFIQSYDEIERYLRALGVGTTSIDVGVLDWGREEALAGMLDVGRLARPNQGMTLLIIWCMLAGFSEKLIPGILNNKSKTIE
jgi:hypothetical protein